jgi:hypothetical protein
MENHETNMPGLKAPNLSFERDSPRSGRCDTKSLIEVVPTSVEGTIRVTG